MTETLIIWGGGVVIVILCAWFVYELYLAWRGTRD